MLETSPAAVVVVWALTARWRGCADVNRQRAAVRDASQYHVNTSKQAHTRTHSSFYFLHPSLRPGNIHAHTRTHRGGGGRSGAVFLSLSPSRTELRLALPGRNNRRASAVRAGPSRTEPDRAEQQHVPAAPSVRDRLWDRVRIHTRTQTHIKSDTHAWMHTL